MLPLLLCLSTQENVSISLACPYRHFDKLTFDSNDKISAIYEKAAMITEKRVDDILISYKNEFPTKCSTLKEAGIISGSTLEIKNRWEYEFPEDKKPVIYLYPTEDIDAKVSVKAPLGFNAVYPEFTDKQNSEWSVHAEPSGRLTVDGRQFTSLFWEAKTKSKSEFIFGKGFVVKSEDAIKFLEEKLSKIGLTNLEANEFITYWLPTFNKNVVSVVSFQFENHQNAVPLIVTPKPDSMLRVFLAIRKAKADETIEEQEIPTFQRKGFSVIEWGGSSL